MVSGGNSTDDGCLLLIIGESFTSKVSRAPLGYLEDDRGFDVPSVSFKHHKKLRYVPQT
jgi:hypothetical protein